MANVKGSKPMTRFEELTPSFWREVAKEPGGELSARCFACGTCTAACPVHAVDARYNPRQLVHMILLGMRERVLSSDFIWLCSGCYTCADRCPQGVRVTDIMTAVKNIAAREGYLHPTFRQQAELVGRFGRLYEVEDFDNKKRQRLGLPPVRKTFPEVQEIFRMTGMGKYTEAAEANQP
ncbi:MAG: 4Fe-4S dicluster domain-containing protein [bacterium]|nr:4Fe-4S dicluster domain-containing protein [candidate division KSB1 bacterium]MDH7559391.1 4Fe-4S dicluster domain-containing protein [bacterium]